MCVEVYYLAQMLISRPHLLVVHCFCGSHATITPYISRETLVEHVRNAWMHLRYLSPLIGARTIPSVGGESHSYLYSYEVSGTNSAAVKWADASIVWTDIKKSLAEWEVEIKDQWWKPSASHFNMELHVAPGEGNTWIFMLVILSLPRLNGSHTLTYM